MMYRTLIEDVYVLVAVTTFGDAYELWARVEVKELNQVTKRNKRRYYKNS